MKITAIKQQVKNPERVSVFVDGKYSFSLSLDDLLKEKLKKDQELDEADVKRFRKISADGKLKGRALEWALNRPHSIREFRDYMRRKKAEAELVENLIEEFSDKGYLDDAKFTQWFIELRERRGKSNRAIRSELFSKGVSREVVDDAMGAGSNEAQRLKALIEKKRKSSRYKNDSLKLKQYLVQQGFSYQLVKDVLSEVRPR